MKRKCASLLLIPGLLSPGIAAALGLGEIKLDSYLNEPLQAEVRLLETDDLDPTQIRVRLATRDDFSRAGVDRAYFLTSLKFEVVEGSDGSPLLVITSREPVREPFLDFIVEARWPNGRLLREYTLLLDPPVFSGEGGLSARASTSRPTSTPTSRPSAPAPAPEPRPAPQRNFGADALDRPVSGESYLVERSDTLWQIASVARPGDASVQQTMLDIQRMNPEAFIGGNINQLKAGYVLRLPTADEITPQSFEEAVAEVERQAQRWQDAAAGLDVRMDASEGLDMSGVSGSDRGEGHLQIAGVDGQDESFSSADVSARMEDLDRSRRENAELSTRVSSMEDQLEMQQRLISLKDEQIAALQDALANAGAEVELPEEVQEGTIEPLEPLEPEVSEATAGETPAEAETLTPAEPAEAATPPPAPRPQPAPPPPAPTLLDMVMENIIYVGAGALALILLVLFLLRSKLNLNMRPIGRKKDQEQPAIAAAADEDDFADVSLSDDSLIVDEVDEDDEAEPAEAVSNFSAPDEEAYAAQFESGDALAEADIYIAYGRFPQAVDLLKAAIIHEPLNTDYRIKLMEACIEMVESGEFQQQYADLQVIGDENVLNRARSLLEAVDGGEVWLNDLPAPSITPEQVAEGGASRSSAAPMESVDLGMDDLDSDPEIGLDADIDGDELDDDLSGDLSDDLSGDLSGDLSLEDEDDGLDLALDDSEDDLGLELDAGEDDDLDLALDDETGGDDELELSVDEEEDDDSDLDFDLDSLAEEPSDEPADEPAEVDELEIDLDIAAEESAAEEDISLEEAAEDETDELPEIDLPDLETDDLDDAPVAEDDDDDDIVALAADDDDDLLSGLDDLAADLEDDAADEGGLDDLDMTLDEGADDLMDLGSDLDSDLDSEPASEPTAGDDESLLDLSSDLAADDEAAEEESLLDLAADVGTAAAAEPSAEDDETLLDLDSDLDGVEFDLDDDSGGDFADLELDMSGEDEEGLVFAADGDEIATKLDLARAYIDMGDHEGARAILDEVITSGSESQQQEARSLLEGID